MRAVPKPVTVYFPKYRASFRDKSCVVCGHSGDGSVVGHHLAHSKSRDDWLIALCGRHHQGRMQSVHRAPIEAIWWAEYAPDLVIPLVETNFAGVSCTTIEGQTIIMDALKAWCESDFARWLNAE